MILQNQDLHNRRGSKSPVVRVWAGGISTTPNFSVAHFAKRNTKFGGGGSEGGAGIHFPHTPFSARSARAFSLAREARHQFCSKKVRAKCIITAPVVTCSELRIWSDFAEAKIAL